MQAGVVDDGVEDGFAPGAGDDVGNAFGQVAQEDVSCAVVADFLTDGDGSVVQGSGLQEKDVIQAEVTRIDRPALPPWPRLLPERS